MTLKTLVISVTLSILSSHSYAQSYKSLKKGYWKAHLQLSPQTRLPFVLQVRGSKKKPEFIIHNAEEKIQLSNLKTDGDSIQIDFPNFHSFIRFKVNGKHQIAGNWTNLNKGNNYKITFAALFDQEQDPCAGRQESKLSGRWKTTFSPGSTDQEMAVAALDRLDDAIGRPADRPQAGRNRLQRLVVQRVGSEGCYTKHGGQFRFWVER